MMRKHNGWMAGVAVGMLITVNAMGQTPKRESSRTFDAASTRVRPMEPDSPGTMSPITPNSQVMVPRLMKFSGVLLDVAGKPLSGAVDVTFNLYNTEAGGDP